MIKFCLKFKRIIILTFIFLTILPSFLFVLAEDDDEEKINKSLTFDSLSRMIATYTSWCLTPEATDDAHKTGFAYLVASGAGNAGAMIGYPEPKYKSNGEWILASIGSQITTGSRTYGFNSFCAEYDQKEIVQVKNDTTKRTETKFYDLNSNKTSQSVYKNGASQYMLYGYLLGDLGIDKYRETFSGAIVTLLRFVAGGIIKVLYDLANFVGLVFQISLSALKFLNPFQFLENIDKGSYVYKDNISNKALIQGQYLAQTFDNYYTTTDNGNTSIEAQMIDGLIKQRNGEDNYYGKGIMTLISGIYSQTRRISILVLLPVSLAFLIFQVVLLKTGSFGGRLRKYLTRMIFIFIGIPFLGITYTVFLNQFSDTFEETGNMAANVVILQTFVDFEGWASTARLAPPANSNLSLHYNKDANRYESSSEAVASVRQTAMLINSLVLQDNFTEGKYDKVIVTNPNLPSNQIYDPNSGSQYSSQLGTSIQQALQDNANFNLKNTDISKTKLSEKISNMLSRYMSGATYEGATFESDTKSRVNFSNNNDAWLSYCALFSKIDNLKQTPNSLIAHNMNQINGSKDDLGNSQKLSSIQNADLYTFVGNGGLNTTYDGGTSIMRFNNHGALNSKDIPSALTELNDGVSNYDNRKFLEGDLVSGIDYTKQGGLSTLAMYNYLNSKFTASEVTVYDGANTPLISARDSHFAVNLLGNGIYPFAYWLDAVLILLLLTVIGFFYSYGIMMGNFKRGFSMIFEIPFAMFGSIKSMAKIVVLVAMMLIEIFATIVAYAVFTEIIFAIRNIIFRAFENVIMGLVTASLTSGATGLVALKYAGIVVVIMNIILSIFLLFFSIKFRRQIVKAFDDFMTDIINMVFNTNVSAPQQHSKLLPLAAGAGAGYLLNRAMNKGDKKEEKETVQGSEETRDGSDGEGFIPNNATDDTKDTSQAIGGTVKGENTDNKNNTENNFEDNSTGSTNTFNVDDEIIENSKAKEDADEVVNNDVVDNLTDEQKQRVSEIDDKINENKSYAKKSQKPKNVERANNEVERLEKYKKSYTDTANNVNKANNDTTSKDYNGFSSDQINNLNKYDEKIANYNHSASDSLNKSDFSSANHDANMSIAVQEQKRLYQEICIKENGQRKQRINPESTTNEKPKEPTYTKEQQENINNYKERENMYRNGAKKAEANGDKEKANKFTEKAETIANQLNEYESEIKKITAILAGMTVANVVNEKMQ